MNTKFQPVSLFFGLFANKWPAELNAQEFSQLLHQALPEFDQPPALAQLPPNAPGDAPRIMLFNERKTKVLEIAPVKIQLRCQSPQERPSLTEWLKTAY